jgi:hypothetical protein
MTFQSVFQQALPFIEAGGAWACIGLLGTGLEALGEWKKLPKLIAFGQRLESISTDAPKLLRGSRFTNATVADIAKKVESEK